MEYAALASSRYMKLIGFGIVALGKYVELVRFGVVLSGRCVELIRLLDLELLYLVHQGEERA